MSFRPLHHGPELAWSRDRDYDVDRSYDGGFGL